MCKSVQGELEASTNEQNEVDDARKMMGIGKRGADFYLGFLALVSGLSLFGHKHRFFKSIQTVITAVDYAREKGL